MPSTCVGCEGALSPRFRSRSRSRDRNSLLIGSLRSFFAVRQIVLYSYRKRGSRPGVSMGSRFQESTVCRLVGGAPGRAVRVSRCWRSWRRFRFSPFRWLDSAFFSYRADGPRRWLASNRLSPTSIRYLSETIRGTPFSEIANTFQGYSFTLAEVGVTGSVQVFVDETDASVEAQELGLPRDLDGDGASDHRRYLQLHPDTDPYHRGERR